MRTMVYGFVAACTASATAPSVAEAQDYPDGPVTVVVTYSPGGSSDLSARTLASHATEFLDEDIVVVNRPGAGGITGMTEVANANPDGQTLALGRVATLAVVPALNESLPYDVEELSHLGLLEKNPYACVAGPDAPYDDLTGLIEHIEANPGTVTYSSSGVGTLTQLASAMVLDATGLEQPLDAAIHIPQRGEGPALTAVVGGQVDFFCGNLPPMLSNIEAGQLKPLVVMTPERNEALPDVPTASELGYPELEQVVGWSALVGPPDLAPEAVETWQEVLRQTGESEGYQEAVRKLGSIPSVMGPDETREFALDQYRTFSDLADRLGLETPTQ